MRSIRCLCLRNRKLDQSNINLLNGRGRFVGSLALTLPAWRNQSKSNQLFARKWWTQQVSIATHPLIYCCWVKNLELLQLETIHFPAIKIVLWPAFPLTCMHEWLKSEIFQFKFSKFLWIPRSSSKIAQIRYHKLLPSVRTKSNFLPPERNCFDNCKWKRK